MNKYKLRIFVKTNEQTILYKPDRCIAGGIINHANQ
jgi:hypothetical protein